MDDFLAKPFNAISLKNAISKRLSEIDYKQWFIVPDFTWDCANIGMLRAFEKNLTEPLKNDSLIVEIIKNFEDVYTQLWKIKGDIDIEWLLKMLNWINGSCMAFWLRISLLLKKLEHWDPKLNVSSQEIKIIIKEIQATTDFFKDIRNNWLPQSVSENQVVVLAIEKFYLSSLKNNDFEKKIEELWDMATEIIKLYLHELDDSVKNIKSAIDNNNPKQLEDSAHFLKSPGDHIWAVKIRGICLWLERLWKSWDINRVRGNESKNVFRFLENEVESVKKILQWYLPTEENII